MKKFICFISVVLFIFLTCHFCFGNNAYRFSNPLDEVERVELLYNPNMFSPECADFEFTLMKELEPGEIATFMTEIYQLETKKYGPPPRWGYGWYIVRVTYSNGDVEMLGSYNMEYIRYGERQSGTGIYYFPDNGLENLLAKYVDLSEYPESK